MTLEHCSLVKYANNKIYKKKRKCEKLLIENTTRLGTLVPDTQQKTKTKKRKKLQQTFSK